MNIESLRAYCLKKPQVTEGFPFDEKTLVFKVAGKMFVLTTLDKRPFDVNLKCDPEKAIHLREQHEHEIKPGWHMNKKHWNTVTFDACLSNELLYALIDHSYNLVVQSLSKKTQNEMGLV